MFKICWIKNFNDVVYDYYYDLSDDKVYCINLAEFNKTQIQAGPLVAVSGIFASVCGSIFDGKLMLSRSGSFILLAIIAMVIMTTISLLYDKTYKTQTNYIKEHTSGEHLDVTEVKALLKTGRKYIWGLTLFGLIGLLGAWFGAHLAIYNHDPIGIIIYAAAILTITVFVKMLSPLNLFKLLIKLKKGKNEHSAK